METFETLQKDFLNQIRSSPTLESLETLRIKILGKQSPLVLALKALGQCPPEERRKQGQTLNALREDFEKALENRKKILADAALNAQIEQEKRDATLWAPASEPGYIHPFSQALYEALSIFKSMGFHSVQGPHIETDYYNFTALNIPEDHPARQDHDTFYVKARDPQGHRKVLRTHTSPVQIRTLEKVGAPLKIVAPGRVFRCDSDATHTPNFHQIEGLYLDADVTLGNLKWCLVRFLRAFFKKEDLQVRFRPSYFPFTEPSLEVDIGYRKDAGRLVLEGSSAWLEVLGCGMVHPRVLQSGGVNPEQYQGFAFGMGLERLTMLKYGILDLRGFYEPDLRWLAHYGFRSYQALSEGLL